MSQSPGGSSQHPSKRPRIADDAAEPVWQGWNVHELGNELCNAGIPDNVVKIFERENISGRNLTFLTVDVLMKMGIMPMSNCLLVQEFMEKHKCIDTDAVGKSKIYNDPIHGHIAMHPACQAIIDTQQFQRLRYLKQLGMCYYVYPGAAHNRFEHSLGVCHLAGQFARSLQQNQSNLGITAKDILCVEIAGLCHDLGHGPFSHLFDGKFIPSVLPDRKWQHEDASLAMFDHLLEENELMSQGSILREYGLGDIDIIFIKEMIAGPLEESSEGGWKCKGRPKEKAYLYEIVANKRNGIDVDKFDYFARDTHGLGHRSNFDHNRFIKFARVIEVDGELQICTRDKEMFNMYSLFYTRYILHKTAYQHNVNVGMELMVTFALTLANEHIRIKGRNGKPLKMSECIDDMTAYNKLTDNILFTILESDIENPDMDKAREIVRRIFDRKLYKCVGNSVPKDPNVFPKEDEIKQQILKIAQEESLPVSKEDFIVQNAKLDFGKGSTNPLKKLKVYSKMEPDKAKDAKEDEISTILIPLSFKEIIVRVYSCDIRRDKFEAISKAFNLWMEKYKFRKANDIYATPTRNIESGRIQGTPGTAGKMRSKITF